ncbi:AlpA family phage regulatory protein [Bradyrhizobium sp. AZCC 1620]|uniref:AlpA family phage regulatory protein n=1 Tax=unclassified Bradyrhizobium TaxID=2631580 RepID=UPI003FA53251
MSGLRIPLRRPAATRSESYFDRLETAGKFPRRVSLGERRVAWVKARSTRVWTT